MKIITTCQRKLDNSNGQNWWKCDYCGSEWHELANGKDWLPLSCYERKKTEIMTNSKEFIEKLNTEWDKVFK